MDAVTHERSECKDTILSLSLSDRHCHSTMTALPSSATWISILPRARNTLLLVVFLMWVVLCSSSITITTVDGSHSGSFEMQMVYKYSQDFWELTKGKPEREHLSLQGWPPPGSPEFYHTLVMHDCHKRASQNLLGNAEHRQETVREKQTVLGADSLSLI
ncbi:hypothetical protein L7F22_068443 [Adiantum nelumboides]|nr:hypothetical protein [Adiantum nelumboides]